MSMTTTKEKLYENAVKTPGTSHVGERVSEQRERREEWLIQELMPIISTLPISEGYKKMAERYLSRPVGHSLLASDISRGLIYDLIRRQSNPYNPRATMRFAPGGIIDMLTRYAKPHDDFPPMYRHLIWEKIRETAMDNIWRQLNKHRTRTAIYKAARSINGTCSTPVEFYAEWCAVSDKFVPDLNLINSQWWENRLYELSKYGFTKYTARNIKFYLIVIMACTRIAWRTIRNRK